MGVLSFNFVLNLEFVAFLFCRTNGAQNLYPRLGLGGESVLHPLAVKPSNDWVSQTFLQ